MNNRIRLSAILLVTAIGGAQPAWAADEHNVSNGITTAGVPLGLHGVDAVELTTIHDAAEGSAEHTVVVDGVAYYFASARTAKQFEAAPHKYLPQFGGFCAFAIALGKKFDADPRYADIVNGKLYLFVNAAIFAKYKENAREIISKANRKWPSIQHRAIGQL